MSMWERRRTPTGLLSGAATVVRVTTGAWSEGRSGVPHIGPVYLHAGHRSYRRRMSAGRPPAGRPEDARAQLRQFVLALHQAYLGSARLLPPGEQAAMPLLAVGATTVVVAAARHLHA